MNGPQSRQARRLAFLKDGYSLAGWFVFTVIGLYLLVGGGYLALIGGSMFYVSAGLIFLGIGTAVILKRQIALYLQIALCLATWIWALVEAGLDCWALLARVGLPVGLSVWFLLPPVRRRLSVKTFAFEGDGLRAPVLVLALVPLFSVAALFVSFHHGRFVPDGAHVSHAIGAGAKTAEWSNFGNSPGGNRFSPAAQITKANVRQLKPAWTYRTGALADDSGGFEGPPIQVGNQLVICTTRFVASIDPDTGRERWRYAPSVDLGIAPHRICRGVSYYPGTGSKAFCDARILWATIDNRLHAIDVESGKPCSEFGAGGTISLLAGMGQNFSGNVYPTSPPLIIGELAVLGVLVYDNQSADSAPGVVRAFDVHSGKLKWAWELTSPFSKKTFDEHTAFTRNTANAWSLYSADPALGLIYVPTGNIPPDYFGGQRPAHMERYTSSVVALDAQTGDVRWQFQTVHHDLWDLDIPAQPVVTDIQRPDGLRKALLVPTKRGEIFVLDRVTGVPIFPIEERAVPQGGKVAGEHLSPTQPFSAGFPSFAPPYLQESDLWGGTILDQMLCRIMYRQRNYEGQFTPPSLRGSIAFPDMFGVLNWGSVAVDPERQIMFFNATWLPSLVKLFPRQDADARGIKPYGSVVANGKPSIHGGGWMYAQAKTPYAVQAVAMLSPLGFPCNEPPWGRIAAIDLRRGELLWQRPFGTTRDAAPLGIDLPMGVINMGGAVVTRSGVAFIGATIDDYLRAYDIETGALLWQGRLPAGGQSNPISYVSARTGRQYVVMAAGGNAGLQTRRGDYVVAYALP